MSGRGDLSGRTAGGGRSTDGTEPLRNRSTRGGSSAGGAVGARGAGRPGLDGRGVGAPPQRGSGQGAAGTPTAGRNDHDPALDCEPVANGPMDLCLKPIA